ncbi:MAG: hypothetical protein IV092_26000 [Burkholderiaceae bacterium]|nr:hypothetical protein [Burkholderiaceae bacterium]
MSSASTPPRAVPTLTEVLVEGEAERELEAAVEPGPAPMPGPEPEPEREDPAVVEARITQHVLVDLQRQVDLMLEYRLREALSPALARVCDMLIREARTELASTLRDVVARAVSQELARQRAR